MSLSPHERGRFGNRAAVERNPEHQRDAGRKGIRGLAAKYFDGSIDQALSWLRSRQAELAIATLVAEKHAEMLANGREIAVEELPVLCDPDDDPSYWQDRVSRQIRSKGRTA